MDAVTRLAHSAETYLQVPEMGHRDGATDSGVETGGAPAGMEEVLLRAGRQQEASWETCDLLLSKVTVLRYSDLEAPEVLRPLGYHRTVTCAGGTGLAWVHPWAALVLVLGEVVE